MSTFLKQLKWQFVLLKNNNIISISIVVTIIYGLILFGLKDVKYIDKLLVSLVLNDPSVIGYFFIALAVYSEMKQGIINALFVTPVNHHQYLISKLLSLSVIGTICSLGLVLFVKGLNFNIINFVFGSFSICFLSALVGLIVLTFASDFLNFALLSIPVFFFLTTIPLLQYLGTTDIGIFKYLFPVQGGLDLLDNAVSDTQIQYSYVYISLSFAIPFFYVVAFRLFTKKIVSQ